MMKVVLSSVMTAGANANLWMVGRRKSCTPVHTWRAAASTLREARGYLPRRSRNLKQ